MSKIIGLGEKRQNDRQQSNIANFWRRRQAAVIVSTLPDDFLEALAVLEEARAWVEYSRMDD